MFEISQEPDATARVANLSPANTTPLGYHIVSMFQSIQSGRYFNVKPGKISWRTEDDRCIGFAADGRSWWAEGEMPDGETILSIAPDDDYGDIVTAVEKVMFGSESQWVIQWGRKPSHDQAGYTGYVVHSRPSHGNVPRIEISPDMVISAWHHRPEPDLLGDEYTD